MPKIVFDKSRVGEILLDDLFGFFEGNIYSEYKTLSHFVADDDGQLMAEDVAREWLRKHYTIDQLTDAGATFLKAMRDGAVPPESGGG